jgi:glutamate decarboxylase
VNYLGGNMPTFALNFSRPGAEVVAQYYNFFRLGRSGYTAVQQACRDVAQYVAGELSAKPQLRLVSHGDELPVFAVTTSEAVTGWDVFALSRVMRERGWQIPAYTFPPDREDLSVLRIVCRNEFTRDLAELLLADLDSAIEQLEHDAALRQTSGPAGFHH